MAALGLILGVLSTNGGSLCRSAGPNSIGVKITEGPTGVSIQDLNTMDFTTRGSPFYMLRIRNYTRVLFNVVLPLSAIATEFASKKSFDNGSAIRHGHQPYFMKQSQASAVANASRI